MELIVFPSRVTKKMMLQLYSPMPRREILSQLNFYIVSLGGNKRSKIISTSVLLLFIRDFGTPSYYILNDEMQNKLNRLIHS